MKNICLTLIICAFLLILITIACSQSWTTFRTDGLEKSLDVSLSVDFPSDYENILYNDESGLVANFQKLDPDGDILRSLQISIQGDYPSSLGEYLADFGVMEDYDYCSLSDSEIDELLLSLGLFTNDSVEILQPGKARKITFGGVCGLQIDLSGAVRANETDMYFMQHMFFFGYLNKTVNYPRFVHLNCNTYGPRNQINKVVSSHEKAVNELCPIFFKSLKIYDLKT
jgi:hypothetical protein